MPLNWSTTDVAGSTHGIKALVYGAAGSGKTTLCGTAPSPLIISAEAGLLSLRNKKIPVLEVKTIQDVWDALTWCRNEAAKNGIKTICLDSVSEIVETVLANEKKKTKDPRLAYGETATLSIDLIKSFRDLAGFNVLITAKQSNTTDAITGVSRVGPTAPGQQIGPALPYLFDLVMHAATDKDSNGKTFHYLRTHASFNAEAKDRSGALDEIEFPDFTAIINKIQGASVK
jgi:hypothetical protein